MPLELILFIGLQASGKSTFYTCQFAATHALVSKDRFPNNRNRARRQRQLVAEYLAARRSVVVDNTNVTHAERAELITLGRTHGAMIVGYAFASNLAECLERNRQRLGKARVPDVALYATRKRFRVPTRGEGFDRLYFVRLQTAGQFEVAEFIEEEAGDETG